MPPGYRNTLTRPRFSSPPSQRVIPRLHDVSVDPTRIFELYTPKPKEDVPDIVEFIVSDKYLNRPQIYPRQLTLLKTIFLADELFTQYDYDVLGEWADEYDRTGDHGIVPDIFERIKTGHEEGRKWFREVVAVVGRRGSKGYIGGICASYITWNFISLANPQWQFGIDETKRLACMVFAGKREQAKADQWRDIVNVMLNAPCYTPHIANSLGESLTLWAPHDEARRLLLAEKGIATSLDLASFEVTPREARALAGRGPASYALFFDEMAHVAEGSVGSDRSMSAVYEGAKPSLDQFGAWAFMYEASSPWQQIGPFFTNYQRALEIDDDTGKAVYPEMLMFQLCSWDTYEDWEQTGYSGGGLTMTPDGVPFAPLRGAIQTYDTQMQREEQANPETFAVERRAKFAAVMQAYLKKEKIASIWAPWRGENLEMKNEGVLSVTYIAHGDPSKSGANFGFSIAHRVWDEPTNMHHVVFDFIHAWIPGDYPDNNYEVDYDEIEGDLKGYIVNFMPDEMSFDQFNSAGTIQRLRKFVRQTQMAKRCTVYERTATEGNMWGMYEVLKTSMNMGLVHAPYFELADLELTFLQEKNRKVVPPTFGPVQTKDVADTMAVCVTQLIGEQVAALMGETFASVNLHGAMQGGSGGHSEEAAHEQAVTANTMEALSGFKGRRGSGGRPNGASSYGRPRRNGGGMRRGG